MIKKNDSMDKTRRLALTSLLFAMALILSIVENSLPPILVTVPGVKFGLSNIAVMYALFFLRKKEAFSIVILKSCFVFVTRGFIAAVLSLCGGMLSLIIMALLMLIFKDRISYLLLSVSGAVFHNIGQFIAISLIYSNLYLWVYLPVLLISGVLAGIATAALLRFILPALKRLD
jgi:Predicted membrane protein